MEQDKSGETILVGDTTSLQHPAVEDDGSILSDLESQIFEDMEFEDAKNTITPRTTRGRSRKTAASREQTESPRKRQKRSATPESDDDDDSDDEPPQVRIPGDYVLTPRLFAHPTAAWINCKICEEPFVQQEAYFTRSSCPRCERHSKLYGYMWPKTDKEGKHDDEERVLDHRTVHRFIKPAEERTARKRNRSGTETREVSEVEVEEEVVPVRRGRRGRFTL